MVVVEEHRMVNGIISVAEELLSPMINDYVTNATDLDLRMCTTPNENVICIF